MENGEPRGIVIPVAAVAWTAATAVFLLLRLAPISQARVGGFELEHLSGAWQAHAGANDARFVPTLFQALTALTFEWTSSEVPARLLAFLATASIPAALYLLRPRLGEGAALVALLLLAFDGPAILLGVSASALGFDLALTLWLFALLIRGGEAPPWALAAAGFAVATAGPLALPLLLGAAVVALLQRRYPAPRTAMLAAGGALAGILAASLGFGYGWEGLTVPPFDLFAAGYDDAWSTINALQIAAIYSGPILLGGLAAAAYLGWKEFRAGGLDRHEQVLLAWAAVALLWFLSSANSQNPVALVALTVPLALTLAPALIQACFAMARADWYYARFLVPAALFFLAVATAIALDWARVGRVGDNGEKFMAGLLLVFALSAMGILVMSREALPALFAVALTIAAFPFAASATGIAVSAPQEPLPSPFSPFQARELRDIVLETVADRGGRVIVHPTLEDEIIWPFRNSGELDISSQVTPQASVVLWPRDQPAPDGFAPLEGEWSLIREVEAPTGRFLDYLKWFSNRNTLDISGTPVAVYVRADQ